MALQNASFPTNQVLRVTNRVNSLPSSCKSTPFVSLGNIGSSSSSSSSSSSPLLVVFALDKSESKKSVSAIPNTNYVVPLDKSSCITRPLAEILRDLNKRVTFDKNTKPNTKHIPWYHANRMLSFYAPGWCGEVVDVLFSDSGSVTVVYRVTIRGSDGEAHRESTGTVSMTDGSIDDPVAAAEEIAFCKACARFGLGLYLYHEDEVL